jgi:hypothetical protein
MRGFPKWINTKEDLETCQKLFPEDTKEKLRGWIGDATKAAADLSAQVAEAEKKPPVEIPVVTQMIPHLSRLGLSVDDAHKAIEAKT